jgi:integrase
VDRSPCDHPRAARIIGEKEPSERVLDDTELFAFWRATGRLPYPFGPLYRLLLLTGLRLNEVADAAWPEFDFAKGIWTIPAARMKGKNGKARPHSVPLTAEMLKVLQALPRFTAGPFLFSTSFGKSPVWVGDKAKGRVDARMLRTIKAMTRKRGDDQSLVTLPHWKNHDLRRTVRSRLSELRVNSDVAEAVLAHVRPGIIGTYDKYGFFEEKKNALDS